MLTIEPTGAAIPIGFPKLCDSCHGGQSAIDAGKAAQDRADSGPAPRLKRARVNVVTVFCVVRIFASGASFGIEDMISTSGSSLTILMLLLRPVFWSLPMALVASELGSAIPGEGDFYLWVRPTLRNFSGFPADWYKIPRMQAWSVSRKEYWEASAISVMVLVALLPSALWLHSHALPHALLREGGFYESGSALASLFASILFCRVAIRASARSSRAWFALFALGCFVLAGEEISWGQHLIGFKPPEFIADLNFQGEFNVHNLSTFQSENNLVSGLLFRALTLYLIVLPIAASVFPTLSRLLQRMAIPLPGLAIALAALLVKGADLLNHSIVYGPSFATDTMHLGEVVESLYQFCILWLAIQISMQESRGKT